MKDSDILARLIYRAYIAPDPHAPLEEAALLPFAAALELYARTYGAEAVLQEERRRLEDEKNAWERAADAVKYDEAERMAAIVYAHSQGLSAAGIITAAAEPDCADSCPVELPEEPESQPEQEAPDTHTHTHTAGTNDGEAGTPADFAGYGAGEKREIYVELMAFVAAHGLGARRRIAEASNGVLTLEDVQAMTDCKRVTLSKWCAARAAMEIIEEADKT